MGSEELVLSPVAVGESRNQRERWADVLWELGEIEAQPPLRAFDVSHVAVAVPNACPRIEHGERPLGNDIDQCHVGVSRSLSVRWYAARMFGLLGIACRISPTTLDVRSDRASKSACNLSMSSRSASAQTVSWSIGGISAPKNLTGSTLTRFSLMP